MKTLEFTIEINAPASMVWTMLWDDENYRNWTGVFCEGSYAVSNWNEGDAVHFLTPSGEGMFSVIDKKIDHHYLAFKHLGEIKNFEEQPPNEATYIWSGSMETYELIPNGNLITLKVNVDTLEQYVDYFESTFPKGLERLKELSEKTKHL